MAKTIHLHIHGRARVSTSDSGDWDESKHKRDKGGQFSSTGGGGGASKAAPIKHSTGTGQSFLPKQASIAQGSVVKTGSGFTAKSPTGMKEFFKPGEEAKAKAWSEGKSHAEIAKMAEPASAPGGSERRPQDVYAEHRKDAGAKGQAALDLVAKAETSTDPKVVQEALTAVEAAWKAHKTAGEAFSKIPYPGANDAGAHHAERTQAYSKLAESMHQRLNALIKPAKPKGVSQARVDTTKGNHKPGWMLRADPELAAKFKAAEARLAERKAIK